MSVTPDSYPSLAELRTAVKVMEWWEKEHADFPCVSNAERQTAPMVVFWCMDNRAEVPAMIEKTKKRVAEMEATDEPR